MKKGAIWNIRLTSFFLEFTLERKKRSKTNKKLKIKCLTAQQFWGICNLYYLKQVPPRDLPSKNCWKTLNSFLNIFGLLLLPFFFLKRDCGPSLNTLQCGANPGQFSRQLFFLHFWLKMLQTLVTTTSKMIMPNSDNFFQLSFIVSLVVQ